MLQLIELVIDNLHNSILIAVHSAYISINWAMQCAHQSIKSWILNILFVENSNYNKKTFYSCFANFLSASQASILKFLSFFVFSSGEKILSYK